MYFVYQVFSFFSEALPFFSVALLPNSFFGGAVPVLSLLGALLPNPRSEPFAKGSENSKNFYKEDIYLDSACRLINDFMSFSASCMQKSKRKTDRV